MPKLEIKSLFKHNEHDVDIVRIKDVSGYKKLEEEECNTLFRVVS